MINFTKKMYRAYYDTTPYYLEVPEIEFGTTADGIYAHLK
jgi:hypothetical protein